MNDDNDIKTILTIVIVCILFLFLSARSEVCVESATAEKYIEAVGHSSYSEYIYQTDKGIKKSSTLVENGQSFCIKKEKGETFFSIIFNHLRKK